MTGWGRNGITRDHDIYFESARVMDASNYLRSLGLDYGLRGHKDALVSIG